MTLHFTREEFAARQRRAGEEMARLGLDGLLIFRQESMYYLTGYDTSGYSMFQGMYLRADGALAVLTRSADLRQARLTSVIADIRIWNSTPRPAGTRPVALLVLRPTHSRTPPAREPAAAQPWRRAERAGAGSRQS